MPLQPHKSRAIGVATAGIRLTDREETRALDLAIQECRRAEEMSRSESALPYLEHCLRQVVSRVGLPRRTHVDSGLVYQGTPDSTFPRKAGHPA